VGLYYDVEGKIKPCLADLAQQGLIRYVLIRKVDSAAVIAREGRIAGCVQPQHLLKATLEQNKSATKSLSIGITTLFYDLAGLDSHRFKCYS
jgi:hypothetical protein